MNMGVRKHAIHVALGAAALLVSGCTVEQEVTPTPAPTPSPTLAPGAEGERQHPPLTGGEADVQVTGDVDTGLRLVLEPGPNTVYTPPFGGLTLVWRDAESQILALGGTVFTGSRETGPDLTISLGVRGDGELLTFAPEGDECQVTIAAAEPTYIEGTFECRGLEADGTTVDARGAFGARAS